MFPLVFGIIREEFPTERVPGAIGLISALSAVSGGVGVAVAGPIVSSLGLHFLFWLPLAVIVPITIAIDRFVPPSRLRAPGRVNWRAAVLLSLGLSAVLLAVSETPVWGWLSFKTLGLIALGLVILAVWVYGESRSPAPLINMKLMRVKGIWTCNVFAFTLGVGLYVTYILIPEYVEVPKRLGYGFGASLTGAGVFLLPMTLAVFVAGSQMGRLEKRFGAKRPVLLAGLSMMASYILMAVARQRPWEIYLEPILLGAGVGIAFAGSINLLVENCAPEQTGEVTGMNAVTRLVGGAFGAAAVASILAAATGANGYPSAHGFTVAFLVCAVAIGAGVLVALLIPERRRRIQAFEEAVAVSASAVVPGAVAGEP
jgi:MFS family permease